MVTDLEALTKVVRHAGGGAKSRDIAKAVGRNLNERAKVGRKGPVVKMAAEKKAAARGR